MLEVDRPSIFARIGGFLFFILMALGCLSWFSLSLYNTTMQIVTDSVAVYFDKGAVYMLGAAFGLSSLTFSVLIEGILRRELTEKISKLITRFALSGILIMFVLPYIVHLSINRYMEEKRYTVCREVSYQWLFYKKLVYTNNNSTCESLGNKKGI